MERGEVEGVIMVELKMRVGQSLLLKKWCVHLHDEAVVHIFRVEYLSCRLCPPNRTKRAFGMNGKEVCISIAYRRSGGGVLLFCWNGGRAWYGWINGCMA